MFSCLEHCESNSGTHTRGDHTADKTRRALKQHEDISLSYSLLLFPSMPHGEHKRKQIFQSMKKKVRKKTQKNRKGDVLLDSERNRRRMKDKEEGRQREQEKKFIKPSILCYKALFCYSFCTPVPAVSEGVVL